MSDYVRMTIVVPKDVYSLLRENGKPYMRQPRQQAHWLVYKGLGLAPDAMPPEIANRVAVDYEAQRDAVSA